MINPWLQLPKTLPHILPQDLRSIEKSGTTPQKLGLRLEVLPIPYLGDPVKAPIVLLGLNPGFIQQDIDIYNTDQRFNRENLNILAFENV
jgi:hypothetical protein